MMNSNRFTYLTSASWAMMIFQTNLLAEAHRAFAPTAGPQLLLYVLCVQIQALSADPKYAQLHELLSIFATKDLDAYTSFYGVNARVVESMGIAHDASVETMRLLTLCSLASAKPALPYETVAATIKVCPIQFGFAFWHMIQFPMEIPR
jgi:hypothetical protein